MKQRNGRVIKPSRTFRSAKAASSYTDSGFKSLLGEYHDICEQIASARESGSREEFELLERRKANLEEELLAIVNSNRRL